MKQSDGIRKQIMAMAVIALLSAIVFSGIAAGSDSAGDTTNQPLGYLIGPATTITPVDALSQTASMDDVQIVGYNVYQWIDKGTYVQPITDSTDPIAIAAMSIWFSYCSLATYDSSMPTYTTLLGIPSYATAYPNVLMYIAYSNAGDGVIEGNIDIQVGLASGYEVYAGMADVTVPTGISLLVPTDASTYPTATGIEITNYTGGQPLIDPPIDCNIVNWNVQNFAASGWVLVQQLPSGDNGGNGDGSGSGNGNGNGNGAGAHDWNWTILIICIVLIIALTVVAYIVAKAPGAAAVVILGLIAIVILFLLKVI